MQGVQHFMGKKVGQLKKKYELSRIAQKEVGQPKKKQDSPKKVGI